MVIMARRFGKKRRGSSSKKLPLAIVVPMAIPVIEAGKALMAGEYDNARYIMTGVDGMGRFKTSRLIETYAPVVAGVVVHKVAGRYVNRYIPKWLPVSI